ncbi:aminoglycoside phosphotransferase family protein [Ornithinibacillus sp. BX22]|uniref:Aminoglycoside phosphotransferase family protein n=1 Tax=Ornithinibacillus hominis TaxID=2763055 RepID=A0A923L873_9BACI|nr:aminoglycoside phosphotransferase family protein [Ornithinibacillus hominis]
MCTNKDRSIIIRGVRKIEQLTKIAEGNTATIYLRNNQVVKVFHAYFPKSEARYEAANQEVAYSSGLPVPKIIEVTSLDGNPAIIMEYVNGSTLGELMLDNIHEARYYLNIAVDIQRKIHLVKTDSIEPMTLKLKRQIEFAEKLNEKQKACLIEKMNQITFENRLCHGDLHVFNLIQTGRHVAIIDWVDASVGDVRADVYRTYLLYAQHYPEIAEEYLNLYTEKSGISKEDILEWAPIIAGARLAEFVPTEDSSRLLQIVQDYCT